MVPNHPVHQYSKELDAAKSSQTKSRENKLNKELADLEKEIDENTAINDEQKLQLYTRLEALKFELEKIIEYRTKGASPGTDGLPSEFYKTMWIDISEPLLNAINYGFETGELSISQRRGIIKLIPTKSEELYYIRNWRPLLHDHY